MGGEWTEKMAAGGTAENELAENDLAENDLAEEDRQAGDVPDDESPLRLTAEEMAFLLRGPDARAERNARTNRTRTERRHADPLYADHLRSGDRERQRRRRAATDGGGRPPPEPAVPLPAMSGEEAAERLAEHLRTAGTRQAVQLRQRPDLARRYVEAFLLYRRLALGGGRPTRGALAAAFRDEFGATLTLSQVQNLRDRVEDFAGPGGPWHVPGTPQG